jgi:methyltransferase (TIGR00027 family)
VADVMDTAAAIARIREEEGLLPREQRLFEDPYARLFKGDAEADAVTARFFSVPFFREGVRLRTRFIDDAVRTALAAGLRQVVLLGAGFDCRGLRLADIAAQGALVFEVDFAAQLAKKRVVLEEAGITIPAWVRYVACDLSDPEFEEHLSAALARSGFRLRAGACFVWEGVVGYLDDAAVDRSLGFMARAGGPGSWVVLNYVTFRFAPHELVGRLAAAGFGTVEEIGCETMCRRYLPGEPPPGAEGFRLAVARVA